MNSSGRLPPGQRVVPDLPTLHYGPVPSFNPSTWEFHIWGANKENYTLTWDQFLALPRTQVRLDVHCVTGWSVRETDWEGIRLQTLIQAGWLCPCPEAKFIVQHADFGYSTNLPLAVALQDNFLLATHLNGEPLTPEHGGPLRGVIGSIPGKAGMKTVYLWKGAKWLRGLELLPRAQPGFWEANGYHHEGDIWKEQRRVSDSAASS